MNLQGKIARGTTMTFCRSVGWTVNRTAGEPFEAFFGFRADPETFGPILRDP